MTKKEYLKQLNKALRSVKGSERQRSLAYFSEVIDDRMEDGVPEDQAVSELESVSAAAGRIIAEAGEQGNLKASRSPWMIVLIVLGFPVWFPLLAAVATILLSLYLVIWILIGVLFIISVAFALSGICGVVGLFWYVFISPLPAIMLLGTGLLLAGIGVALFIPALYLAKGFIRATIFLWNSAFHRPQYERSDEQA